MTPTNLSKKSKFFNKRASDNFFDLFYSILIFAIMLIIISNPKLFSSATISGLNLFISSVLPGLFPFMLLTKLLTEIGFLFKITKKFDKLSYYVFGTPGISIYAFLMSILSGYPIGAKIICDLYEKKLISENDCKKMMIFCTTSGPIFVIGAVGSAMLGSLKIGLILYLSHILSSTFIAIIFNMILKQKRQNNQTKMTNFSNFNFQKIENIFPYCISQTINSLFVVGAYITIFYLLTELLDYLGVINFLSQGLYFFAKFFNFSFSQSKSMVYGIFEVTRGLKSLSLISISPSSICLASAIISFSGISIIMQSMSFFNRCKIKMHQFVFAKLMHCFVSFIFCYLFLYLFSFS